DWNGSSGQPQSCGITYTNGSGKRWLTASSRAMTSAASFSVVESLRAGAPFCARSALSCPTSQRSASLRPGWKGAAASGRVIVAGAGRGGHALWRVGAGGGREGIAAAGRAATAREQDRRAVGGVCRSGVERPAGRLGRERGRGTVGDRDDADRRARSVGHREV